MVLFKNLIILAILVFFMFSCTKKTTEPNQCSEPVFNPIGGSYNVAQSVSISTATTGAEIRYTMDGSTPTISSDLYTSPITISETTTLKAIAIKPDWIDSPIASATYTISIPEVVTTPEFNPPGGVYTSAQIVEISCATSHATIHYTIDGSIPTTNSELYTNPIVVSATTTLKAIAIKSGWTDSFIASATYTISIPQVVATPELNPPGGAYVTAQRVTISCATSQATIHYTLDGSPPTSSSPQYISSILISSTTNLKARAFKTGYEDSQIVSSSYTIGIMPIQMIFVEGGTFNNGVSNVTLSSFMLSKYETTQGEYQAMMWGNPSFFNNVTDGPVEQVSWFNIIEYCNRKSINEGLVPCYNYDNYGINPVNWPTGWNNNSDNHDKVSCNWGANGYRLPSEMEWFFAARGGNLTHNYSYSGSSSYGNVAWCSINSNNTTHTVGSKAPNELGLYDMSGNVWEFVWDVYGDYPSDAQINPTGAIYGIDRVSRGGSWADIPWNCAVSIRNNRIATFNSSFLGFRLCRSSLP